MFRGITSGRRQSVMKQLYALVCLLLFVPHVASPEIEKVGQVCEKGVCLAWWPKLDPIEGWHHERGPSFANGVNIQVPDGFTFSNAETVIYAKAMYKPRAPEITSLEALIKDDQSDFLKHDSSIQITKAPSLRTNDSKVLESYTFFPKAKGNWEQVSYGEEGDFYLIFTISSRSHEGFIEAFPVYEKFIAQYKE
jgi:hypothetical protein